MLFTFSVLCVYLSLDPANDIHFMLSVHNPHDFPSTLAQCSARLLSVLMSELLSDS